MVGVSCGEGLIVLTLTLLAPLSFSLLKLKSKLIQFALKNPAKALAFVLHVVILSKSHTFLVQVFFWVKNISGVICV